MPIRTYERVIPVGLAKDESRNPRDPGEAIKPSEAIVRIAEVAVARNAVG